ncbi:hypothetical protein [Aureimonas leprariae]|uniref:Chemotaxis protein MotC n=1 Tax=Plantimonas leprariae TaxID=2615207 RepID=A0A7V7TWS2_9HYPH|nr:hypothetical protein [Aureimonas leprariae]KAB0679900.1 hypothetical protein F6X38_11795 [Aureimonas leprariae]
MTSILARCAGGLLTAAAACSTAFAVDAVGAPPVVVAATFEVGPTPEPVAAPAVSAETVGSVAPSAGQPGEAKSETATSHDDAPAAPAEPEAEHAAAPVAPTRSPMPFDIIRTLQFLQDQVARGNGRAIRVQAMLLRRFGPAFVEADPSIWTDPRNRRAAILFALSGGPPEVLRRLVAAGAFDETTKPIAEGALAYVVNDLPKAGKLLSPIDLKSVEPGMAAQISLVLGQVEQQDRPAEALAHLDQARLLAPGGLVEEAALRLEVVLAEKQGDPGKADDLARQYFDRFSRSSYVGNFLARFAMVFSERPATDPAASLASMLDITVRLDPAGKRELLLAVSRRSLVAGKLELARLAGAEALKIDGAGGEDVQRGNLYAAAAGLAAPDGALAADELRTVDRAQLHPADVDIFDAANTVLSHMQAPDAGEPPPLDAADAASSPVLDRAQKLLDAVAGDLGETK